MSDGEHSTALKLHGQEVSAGQRFEFGKNWRDFLSLLDDQRIATAEQSLRDMLEVQDLAGKTFLDIGSGSGLFSLAARRLGAKVFSFDYDPQSVACTAELKRRYFEGDDQWQVERGSVLDAAYLQALGRFDIVYSWGVLHHTGQMWQALANVDGRVVPGGTLFIALYNDQGPTSRRWLIKKQIYNRLPKPLNGLFAVLVYLPGDLKMFLGQLLRGRPMAYFNNIIQYRKRRGMSWLHDKIDWIGGLPFEVCKPEQVFDFYRRRGFLMTRMTTNGGGLGCNQFVFRRDG